MKFGKPLAHVPVIHLSENYKGAAAKLSVSPCLVYIHKYIEYALLALHLFLMAPLKLSQLLNFDVGRALFSAKMHNDNRIEPGLYESMEKLAISGRCSDMFRNHPVKASVVWPFKYNIVV
jgi:hypothetical protein